MEAQIEEINGIDMSGDSCVSFLVKFRDNTQRWLPCKEIAMALDIHHFNDYIRREKLVLNMWYACLGNKSNNNDSVVSVVSKVSKRVAKPNLVPLDPLNDEFEHSAIGSRSTSNDDGQRTDGSKSVIVRPMKLLRLPEAATLNADKDNANGDSIVVSGLKEIVPTALGILKTKKEKELQELKSEKLIQAQVENAIESLTTPPSSPGEKTKEVVAKSHRRSLLATSDSDSEDESDVMVEKKTANAASPGDSEEPDRRQILKQLINASEALNEDQDGDNENHFLTDSDSDVTNYSETSSEMESDQPKENSDMPNANQHHHNMEVDPTEEDTDVYIVEKILNHRRKGKTTEYLIKWENYDSDHNTWEPAKNCAPDVIAAYEKSLAQKKKKRAH